MRRLTLGITLVGIAAALVLLGRASLTAAGPDDRPEDAKLSYTNKVEGRTTLLDLVPNGKRVKKGEILAELDSAALRDRLIDQEIRTIKARHDFMQGKAKPEVAEIALKEYQEGTYPQEQARLQGEVALARSELDLAEARLKLAQDTAKEDPVGSKKAELDRELARIGLRKAESALDILEHFTLPAVKTRLQADIERARSEQLVKNVIYQLEKSREEKLTRQIAECKIVSLFAGKVIHSRIDGGDEVKEGTVLRERQEVLRMIPDRDEEKP